MNNLQDLIRYASTANSIENLFSQAKQYPDVYLKPLELRLRNERSLGFNLFLEILDFYLAQFRRAPPSNIASDRTHIYALIGVWRCIENTGSNPTIVRTVLSAAPNFWLWMDSLHREFIAFDQPISAQDRQYLAVSISVVLMALLSQTSLVAPKGAIRVAINVYIDLGRRPPAERDLDTPLWVTLVALVNKITQLEPSYLVEALGFDKLYSAESLFGPVNMCVEGGERWVSSFPLVVAVPFTLCGKNPTFFQTLPAMPVISSICRALSYYVTLPPSISNARYVKGHDNPPDCIFLLLRLLRRYACESVGGHSWLIYGLQFDLLSLILRSDAYSTHLPGIAEHSNFLLDHIRTYAIHRPILQRMLKDKALKDGPYTKNAKALKTWNILLEGIRYAQAAYADLDASGRFPPKCCHTTVLFMFVSLVGKLLIVSGSVP
ncbi:hypothetical protein DXG01_016803 [Tephrocybe rancida]|nr:hypothetical protein DXG01_016803 [Tephrocybe rancida]